MKKILRIQQNDADEEHFIFSMDDKKMLQQLKWEGDDEFSLRGEMYDVIEKKVEDGKMFLRCIADKKETLLVNKLSDNWRENERSSKAVNELLQLLQGLFHQPRSEEFVFDQTTKFDFCSPVQQLLVQIKRVLTPPPQA